MQFTARLSPSLLVSPILLVAAACGGAGGTAPPQILEGQLFDSYIQGVTFQAGGVSGVTDGDGRFQYPAGANVQFRVGDIVMGSPGGQAKVSLLDLAGTDEVNDTVVNLARFVQTLDADGDPSNGIDVPVAASLAAEGKSLDFGLSQVEWELQANSVVGELTTNPLVSAEQATAHLESWLVAERAGLYSGQIFGIFGGGSWWMAVGNDGHYTVLVDVPILQNGYWFNSGEFPITSASTFEGESGLGTLSGQISDGGVQGSWTGAGLLEAESGTFSGSMQEPGVVLEAAQLASFSAITGLEVEGQFSGEGWLDGAFFEIKIDEQHLNGLGEIEMTVGYFGTQYVDEIGDFAVTEIDGSSASFVGLLTSGHRIDGVLTSAGDVSGTYTPLLNSVDGLGAGTFAGSLVP